MMDRDINHVGGMTVGRSQTVATKREHIFVPKEDIGALKMTVREKGIVLVWNGELQKDANE